jgi:Cu/Ag efflux pump CusA
MIPLASALGAGSQVLRPLAVIGGVLASMVPSLIVTPSVRWLIADRG